MKELFTKKIKRIISFVFLVACVIFSFKEQVYAAEYDNFWVEFIDVGQGDCALIQCVVYCVYNT